MNDQSSHRSQFKTSQHEESAGPGLNPTDNRTMGEIIATCNACHSAFRILPRVGQD